MLIFLLQVQTLTDDLGREVLVERDRRRVPRVQDRRRHDRRRAPQEHHGGQEGRRGIKSLSMNLISVKKRPKMGLFLDSQENATCDKKSF